ncbi:MAG TPA: FUSC family protein, partial [Reyranella sp.]|nr:FUSC family protein [Reyranella sp.]
TAATYMRANGVALLSHLAPAPLEPFETALRAYTDEIAAMRQEGATRAFSGEVTERFFATGFALEQMHQNFIDLERVVREWGPAIEEETEV